MPAPFGWDPVGFWVTFLTLGVYGVLCAIGIPWSMRRWERTDQVERERVAAVLRGLAVEMRGEFAGPREVMGVADDGEEYGPVLDYGTATVASSGMTVEVGVQVLGGIASKCVKLRVPLPEGRSWPAGANARTVRRHLVRDAVDARLDAPSLVVWVAPPSGRATARVDGVKNVAALVPHVDRAAAAAARLLSSP